MIFTTIDGATISYSDTGAGPAAVLLHCSASSCAQWRSLREALQTRFNVIAPDLYGYGETDAWPGHRPLSLADEADLVRTVMSNATQPVHLVGHSYGGAVALRVALEQPHRVRSLTLIEPVAFYLLRDGDPEQRALMGDVRKIATAVSEAVISGDYWGGMARFVDFWNGAGAWDQTRHKVRMDLARRTAKVALDFHATMSEWTPLHSYRDLRSPTLILRGEQAPRTTRAVTDLLARTIPGVRTGTIAGAGHMAPISHPEAVNAAIVRHLDMNSETGTTPVVRNAA